MNVIRKDASIEPVGPDDEFPGRFRVILSAPTLDRDGDTLLPDEWKQPLPDHITFDADHGMSVASTVGSGVPAIDPETGNLIVEGTYSSIPRAQEVRTLVNEGHIRTTSVAFMTAPSTEKGAGKVRELLNGAFVAIPSNREALVLDSKGAQEKVGARNSGTDLEHIQAIHDSASALGADCAGSEKHARADLVVGRRVLRSHVEEVVRAHIGLRTVASKSIVGSLEATQDRVTDAIQDAYPGAYAYLRGTIPDGDGGGMCVFELWGDDIGPDDEGPYQQSYTDDGSVVALTGDRVPVDVMQVVTPDPDEDAEPAGASATPVAGEKSPAAGSAKTPAGEADSKAVPTPATVRMRLQAMHSVTDVV